MTRQKPLYCQSGTRILSVEPLSNFPSALSVSSAFLEPDSTERELSKRHSGIAGGEALHLSILHPHLIFCSLFFFLLSKTLPSKHQMPNRGPRTREPYRVYHCSIKPSVLLQVPAMNQTFCPLLDFTFLTKKSLAHAVLQ